ncbi:hypothetical protein GN956_G22371 [Arapaima gigas]
MRQVLVSERSSDPTTASVRSWCQHPQTPQLPTNPLLRILLGLCWVLQHPLCGPPVFDCSARIFTNLFENTGGAAE